MTLGAIKKEVIMSKHLTDSERLRILEEYLMSSQSKYAIAKKYRIAQCLINDWLRKFGLEDKIPQDPMKTSPVSKSDLTLKEREELERLRQENRLLKTKLKRESLGHEAYKLLVELAEETYGIEIRKNSEAK